MTADLASLLAAATPGPWHLWDEDPEDEDDGYRYIHTRNKPCPDIYSQIIVQGEDCFDEATERANITLASLAPVLAQACLDAAEELRRTQMFLDDAIEATGCDEDDLINEETENVWVRVICARDTARAALAVLRAATGSDQ